jgi:hypothetical protein
MKKSSKMLGYVLLVFVLLFSFTSLDSLKAASTSLTVSQAIQQQNNSINAVEGYVIGKPTSASSVITSNYPDDYSLAIADLSTETNTAKMLYVQIPSQFRTQFGLKSNPELKGEKIKVTGNLTAYYSHPGLKNTSEMILLSSGGGSNEGGYEGEYYDQAHGKSGATLKTALHNIIDDHTEISYSNVWEALRNTDEDPVNPNNVILLYTGRSQSKLSNGSGVDNWNREHVWAKSHGDFGTTMGAGTDLHHLRPTHVEIKILIMGEHYKEKHLIHIRIVILGNHVMKLKVMLQE